MSDKQISLLFAKTRELDERADAIEERLCMIANPDTDKVVSVYYGGDPWVNHGDYQFKPTHHVAVHASLYDVLTKGDLVRMYDPNKREVFYGNVSSLNPKFDRRGKIPRVRIVGIEQEENEKAESKADKNSVKKLTEGYAETMLIIWKYKEALGKVLEANSVGAARSIAYEALK